MPGMLMVLLEHLLPLIQDMTRDVFIRQHPHAVLVADPPSQAIDNDDWQFRTQSVVASRLEIISKSGEHAWILSSEDRIRPVHPLCKSQQNPWREHLTVGRARNNDVVLFDNAVSKLHAAVSFEKEGLSLQDAGSRNGTHKNDVLLSPGEKVMLKNGDVILFGGVRLVYFDAGGLYDFIRSQAKPRSG